MIRRKAQRSPSRTSTVRLPAAGQAERSVLPAILGDRSFFVGSVARRGGLLGLRPADLPVLFVVNIVLLIDARHQLLGELRVLVRVDAVGRAELPRSAYHARRLLP